MSRTVGFSLISGLMLVLLALIVGDFAGGAWQQSGSLTWSANDMRVIVGTRSVAGETLEVAFNDAGQAIVEVDANGAQLDDLPLFKIVFKKKPGVKTMVVAWRRMPPQDQMVNRRFDFTPGQTAWFNLGEDSDWQGRARTLGVIILGTPGERVALESMALLAPVIPHTWQANLANWTNFVPWKQASVNAHRGVAVSNAATYPVPFVAAVLVASLLIYRTWLLVLGKRAYFQWRVVAGLFLCCWLILDLVWQARLLRQLELTRETFAGKTPGQKREAGADRALYQFIARVQEQVGSAESRIFVTSSGDYQGMRGAYYLYPRNVFWQRNESSLPEPEEFDKGDYIVVIAPTPTRYDKTSEMLLYGQNRELRAELIFSDAIGGLFRVI